MKISRSSDAQMISDHSNPQLAFLLEASEVLGSSLEYNTTLKSVAWLAVPHIADWCVIHLVEQNALQPLIVTHIDPEKIKWAADLAQRYPNSAEQMSGIQRVYRSGKSEIYPEIPDEMLVGVAQDAEHLRMLRRMGFSSVIIVPLIARERTLGVISLVRTASAVPYGEHDLALAEDLARRSALAIDNSLLHREFNQTTAELERRVNERTAQLLTANEELEAFSYSVAHDLRTPLRTIDGFSQALLEDYGKSLNEEGLDYLDRIRKAIGHMAQLIDSLLELARVSRTELHYDSIDLDALAQSVAAELREMLPKHPVRFTSSPGMEAFGDIQLIRIVVQNLLANAWKFTADLEEPVVEFSCQQIDGKRIYTVRDNGAGFDMAHAAKLFSPFQRLHSADAFPGIGVGLALTERIIRRHGGRIWAEASVDKGATFCFTLKLAAATDKEMGPCQVQ